MENYEYTAFISYRHKAPDEIIAKKLHTMIENYHIPANLQTKIGRKKMGRVFRDAEELPLSRDLGSDIHRALENSEWLIVICSPTYKESKWCNAELDYYISLGRRDRILALIVEGERDDSFPEQLRFKEIDGKRIEVEPLIGDVRAESVNESLKKLGSEKLRILAAMLDVNFDELKQRAAIRKRNIIMAATAAVFVLMTGFLTYAFIKNAQISEQRNIAVKNQMQVLIEQANTSSSSGNKLLALQQLQQAGEIRKQAGNSLDEEFTAALEYALYNVELEPVLHIDSDNRQFDEMVFSHDDRYLLGITNLNSACLIDASTGELLFTVSRSNIGQLDSVGFTSEDRYFYMVDSWYGFVSLYSTETGELYREYDASDGNAWNIGERIFALSNNTLLIAKDNVLVLWNYEADTSSEVLPCGTEMFEGYIRPFIIDVSPDEQSVVVGSHGYGAGMKILSLDGKTETRLQFDKDRGYPNIMYSGNGERIAASSGNRYYVWNTSGQCILEGENSSGESIEHIVINYDGSVLLIMSANYLKAVNVANETVLWEKQTDSNIVTEAYISGNGRYVSSSGGISGIFDIITGETLYSGAATVFSNDSRKVLVGTYSSDPVLLVAPESATLYSIQSFNEELYYTQRYTDPEEPVSVTLQHNCPEIYSSYPESANRKAMFYSDPDLKYAAYTHYDGFIEVFDISDGHNTKNLYCMAEHCFSSVSDLVFHGELMASCGGYDARCVLFDLEKGQIRNVLLGNEYCHFCEFSPDGTKIIMLCGYDGRKGYVYSTSTGNLLYEMNCPQERTVTDASFSIDGSKAVLLLDDGSAIVGLLYDGIDVMLTEATKR